MEEETLVSVIRSVVGKGGVIRTVVEVEEEALVSVVTVPTVEVEMWDVSLLQSPALSPHCSAGEDLHHSNHLSR